MLCHTLVPCWMSKPLPLRNHYTGWFAPPLGHQLDDWVLGLDEKKGGKDWCWLVTHILGCCHY